MWEDAEHACHACPITAVAVKTCGGVEAKVLAVLTQTECFRPFPRGRVFPAAGLDVAAEVESCCPHGDGTQPT